MGLPKASRLMPPWPAQQLAETFCGAHVDSTMSLHMMRGVLASALPLGTRLVLQYGELLPHAGAATMHSDIHSWNSTAPKTHLSLSSMATARFKHRAGAANGEIPGACSASCEPHDLA